VYNEGKRGCGLEMPNPMAIKRFRVGSRKSDKKEKRIKGRVCETEAYSRRGSEGWRPIGIKTTEMDKINDKHPNLRSEGR